MGLSTKPARKCRAVLSAPDVFEQLWRHDRVAHGVRDRRMPLYEPKIHTLQPAFIRRRSRSERVTMKSAIGKLMITMLATMLLAESCYAQATGGGGSGGGRKRHEQKADKPTAQTPKADEKAYNATLKSLSDKPFDPWRGAR